MFGYTHTIQCPVMSPTRTLIEIQEVQTLTIVKHLSVISLSDQSTILFVEAMELRHHYMRYFRQKSIRLFHIHWSFRYTIRLFSKFDQFC